jgi:hypothetical protein
MSDGRRAANVRFLATVNIETIEASRFLVINLYGATGHLIDQIITPAATEDETVQKLRELAEVYGQTDFECWTSDLSLYKRLLTEPGIAASIKHPDDTCDTRRAILELEPVLRELYDIEPIVKKPTLPKWRRFLLALLIKLENLLKGDGRYEI